jgi:hypothetical protein
MDAIKQAIEALERGLLRCKYGMPGTRDVDVASDRAALSAALAALREVQEDRDGALWRALMNMPGARRRIWNHVLDDEAKAGHESVEAVIAAMKAQP